MAAHEHGKMDTTEQERTFNGFIKGIIWLAVVCIAIAVFLAVFNS